MQTLTNVPPEDYEAQAERLGLGGQLRDFQVRWDMLSQQERDEIRSAVLFRSAFLMELYIRDLHSSLVLAACLLELHRRTQHAIHWSPPTSEGFGEDRGSRRRLSVL